jgi:hypothetical protein
MAYISVTYSFSNATVADATQVNTNFADLIAGLSDGTKDIKINTLTVEGISTLKANVGVTGTVTATAFVGNITGNVTGTVSGNAGTVTNGVYTTGNQTIAGVKTFSDGIAGTNSVGTHNFYRNGSFESWPRGTSVTLSSSGASAKDTYVRKANTGDNIVTRQTVTPGDLPEPARYYLSIDRIGDSSHISFSMGPVHELADKTVSVSFYAKATTNLTCNIIWTQSFGSGGSSDVNTNSTEGSLSITTSWTKFTRTFAVPAITGKTIGAGNYNRILIGQSATDSEDLDIALFMVNTGAYAAPFQKHPEEQLGPKVLSVSGNTTIFSDDLIDVILVTTGASTITITLPPPNTYIQSLRRFTIKKADGDSGSVNIVTSTSGATIDGVSGTSGIYLLSQGASVDLVLVNGVYERVTSLDTTKHRLLSTGAGTSTLTRNSDMKRIFALTGARTVKLDNTFQTGDVIELSNSATNSAHYMTVTANNDATIDVVRTGYIKLVRNSGSAGTPADWTVLEINDTGTYTGNISSGTTGGTYSIKIARNNELAAAAGTWTTGTSSSHTMVITGLIPAWMRPAKDTYSWGWFSTPDEDVTMSEAEADGDLTYHKRDLSSGLTNSNFADSTADDYYSVNWIIA